MAGNLSGEASPKVKNSLPDVSGSFCMRMNR